MTKKKQASLDRALCIIMDLKQKIFLEQLKLAPEVPLKKRARDTKRILEKARQAPFFDGGPYKTRSFSKVWKEAIIAKHSEMHDSSKWDLVVAKEWRRLGINNWQDGEIIERNMHWACFNRFINITNLHMLRIWGP